MTPLEMDQLAAAIADRLAERLGDTADPVGDIHDAAKWLGCSVATIERAVRRGKIPSLRIGNLRRFRRVEILEAFSSCD